MLDIPALGNGIGYFTITYKIQEVKRGTFRYEIKVEFYASLCHTADRTTGTMLEQQYFLIHTLDFFQLLDRCQINPLHNNLTLHEKTIVSAFSLGNKCYKPHNVAMNTRTR